LSLQHGLHLGSWYPRLGISGPIIKGKAWFSDTFYSAYTESLVTGLPSGQNTRSGLLGSNLFHAQVNLRPSNILFADFLINIDNEGRVGLSPLNPVSTTSSVHTRQYFGSIKDQISFSRGALVEFGYAHNEFLNTQTPQGQGFYIITPQGNSGNYFGHSTQQASRDEGRAHVYFPEFQFLGLHQVEAGVDADRLYYAGDFRRTGYEVFGNSGQLISQTVFPAPAIFHTSDAEIASWALDNWHVSNRFLVTLGLRQDWDRRLAALAWSPRAGFAWSPFASGRTRISGGYALTHDAVTMDILGQPLDEVAVTTFYNANGAPVSPAASTTFTLGNSPLVLPRATNWNFDVDHQVSPHIYAALKYLRRRGSDGFAFINTLAPNAPPSLLPLPTDYIPGIYQLENVRRDDYDSVQFSIRQTFSGQYEWMAAYTRSRALSNAVLDQNTAQPLQVLPTLVPMPWDAPNRFLAWTYLPLPWRNWAISALADMRSGFPFSVRDQNGTVIGPVDSYRYPLNFDLNLAIERMVTLHGYRFALRGGVNNLTNQLNPTAVNNVVGAPRYLQFLGGEGRHFVVRIRFFGRAEAAPVAARRAPEKPAAQPVTPANPAQPATAPAPAETTPRAVATIYGNTGLWKVFSADTLSRHQFAASIWYDRINRNPGELVVSTFGFGGAVGLTNRLELGISLEADREVTTGRPDQLSFGQQALGFFGNKTPGSAPLSSELMPGSSKVPQLRSPATPTGALTGAAGYFNLYPFAGLVSSGSAMGDVLFGLKIKLLSESNGAPFGLAIRPYFDLPIHKAITFLETHPVGTADLQGGADGIISKNIGDNAELFLNAGYRYISQPVHVSVFRLAKDAPLGFGITVPRSTRIQFVAESTADVFIGAHTPNTTFGAQDPVDLTVGARGSLKRSFTFSAGYRRPLNQFGGNKNGFVLSFGFTSRNRF